ncbi:MAG: hypothetical protein NTY67_00390 [Cyanobacteria bacterium]|nr:hypothetical protein [Cyanobacteriota bacterium]
MGGQYALDLALGITEFNAIAADMASAEAGDKIVVAVVVGG